MREAPYRIAAAEEASPEERDHAAPGHPDRELVPVLGLAWAVSLAHLVAWLVRGERPGGVGALAALIVVTAPLLLRDALRRH